MSDDDRMPKGQNPTRPGFHKPIVNEDEAATVVSGARSGGEPPPQRQSNAGNPVSASSGEIPLAAPPARPAPPEASRNRNYVKTPLVEIEVIHEHGPAPRSERPWRTLEVWTRNRIYTMDPTAICIDVVDQVSGKSVPEHAFLGSRLVGGQHREGEQIELSCPFPRPGTEAVFEHTKARQGNFSRTSTVTRVVLRLHVVTVSPNYVVPTWETLTGSIRVTDP